MGWSAVASVAPLLAFAATSPTPFVALAATLGAALLPALAAFLSLAALAFLVVLAALATLFALLAPPLHSFSGSLDSSGEAIAPCVTSALLEVRELVDALLLAALILLSGTARPCATLSTLESLSVAAGNPTIAADWRFEAQAGTGPDGQAEGNPARVVAGDAAAAWDAVVWAWVDTDASALWAWQAQRNTAGVVAWNRGSTRDSAWGRVHGDAAPGWRG